MGSPLTERHMLMVREQQKMNRFQFLKNWIVAYEIDWGIVFGSKKEIGNARNQKSPYDHYCNSDYLGVRQAPYRSSQPWMIPHGTAALSI